MLAPFRPTPSSRSHAVPQEIQFLLGRLPGFSAPEKSMPRDAENPKVFNSFLCWDCWLWVAEHLAKHHQLRTWSDPTEPRAAPGPRASTKKLQPSGSCPARGPNPGRSGLLRASGSGIPVPLHTGAAALPSVRGSPRAAGTLPRGTSKQGPLCACAFAALCSVRPL